MKMRFAIAAVAGLIFLSGCSSPQQPVASKGLPAGSWIDLSHDFSTDTIYWPTAESFKHETVAEGMTPQGYYYSAYRYSAAEHGGTHLDAPVHFAEGRNTADRVPLSQLIGPAVKVDVIAQATANRDYLISVADIQSWESQHGRIPDGSILLLQTGWSNRWPDRSQYLGTSKLGEEGVAELHFPGVAPETARWLSENRKINAIGIDTASIDFGQSKSYESHRILMALDIPGFENVANLDRVPATGATIVALPMKIKGGSGGPLRIVAFVPE